MHIENNMCDSLIGTLLNIKGKKKDGVNACLDLIEMNIREELAPREVGNVHTCLQRVTLCQRNRKKKL